MHWPPPPRSKDYVDESHSGDTPPSLPTELLEQILSEAWLTSMTPPERKMFVKYVSRTSKIWSDTLLRVSTRDIYTSLLPPDRNRRSLEEEYPFCWRSQPEYPPFHLCRSYTLQVPFPRSATRGHTISLQRLRKRAIRDLLWTFRGMSYAPNLSRLSVEYFSPTSPQDPEYFPTTVFHLPIIRLEVGYTFSDTPIWLLDELGLNGANHQCSCKATSWKVPDIYHISAPDNDPVSFGNILRMCPHLEIAGGEDLNVEILSSSDRVSKEAALVHGSLSFMRKFTRTPKKESEGDSGWPTTQTIIQGRALALVLNDTTRDEDTELDPTQTQRFLELFKYRNP